MNSVPNPKPTAPSQGEELQSSHELQAREEPNPFSLLGQPQIRRPERLTPRQWIWKAAGFLLMGMGGVALAVFALVYLTLLSRSSDVVIALLVGLFSAAEVGAETFAKKHLSRRFDPLLLRLGYALTFAILFLLFVVLRVPVVSGSLEEPVAAIVSGVTGISFCYLGYGIFRQHWKEKGRQPD